MSAYGFLQSLFLAPPVKKQKIKIILISDAVFLNNLQFLLLLLNGIRSQFHVSMSAIGIELSLRWG